MVGILVSFWDDLFSGAMLVSGRVNTSLHLHNRNSQPTFVTKAIVNRFTNSSRFEVFSAETWDESHGITGITRLENEGLVQLKTIPFLKRKII